MFRDLVRVSLWLLFVVFISLIIIGLLFWHREEVRFFSIHSDKLDYSVAPGDLVIAKNIGQSSDLLFFEDIKDREVMIIPFAGYIFDFLRRPIAMIAVVYLPALLIIASELKKIIRHGYQPYKIARYL